MGKCQLCDSHINGRLRDTVKQEEVYLKAYAVLREANRELCACFRLYDTARPCQVLGCRTPPQIYLEAGLPRE